MDGTEHDPGEIEDQVASVLDGRTSYDDVEPHVQTLVRQAWARRITARREALNMEDRFLANGVDSWSEADSDGRVVIRDAQTVRDERGHD